MPALNVIHPITRLILGGAQQNTMETCALLDRSRFAPQIIAGPEIGPEGEVITEVRQRGIPLTILPELVFRPDPVKDFKALLKMQRLFAREKPAIVHTHSSKAGILGRWAARLARVPVIVHTVHGWGHHPYQHVLMRNLYKFLERRTVGFTDKLIVVSRLNADKGLRDRIGSPEKYITIHSSINLDAFMNVVCDPAALKKSLGIDPQRPVVGTVGRFTPQKNPLDFVRVAARVRERMPDAQFLFVGDGSMRRECEQLRAELGLDGAMFFPGTRQDVPHLLRCMDIFILTSLWEGLPRVIPQAMAAGLPVVANGVDGVCEVVRDNDNGFLIPPHNIELMAEKIIRLLADPALRERIGSSGRETACREFSVVEMVKRIEALYGELLRSKRVG